VGLSARGVGGGRWVAPAPLPLGRRPSCATLPGRCAAGAPLASPPSALRLPLRPPLPGRAARGAEPPLLSPRCAAAVAWGPLALPSALLGPVARGACSSAAAAAARRGSALGLARVAAAAGVGASITPPAAASAVSMATAARRGAALLALCASLCRGYRAVRGWACLP